MKTFGIAAASFCLVIGQVHAEADATRITTEAAVGYDSNVSRAERSSFQLEDFFLDVGIRASRSLRINDRSGLVFNAGAVAREQERYHDLGRISLSAGARYLIQPIAGFTAPWFEAGMNFERLEHRDSEIRDGWVNTFYLAAAKYFTDRLKMKVQAGWQYRNAEAGQVFDYHHRELRIAADYRTNAELTIYGGMSRIFGDQVSTAAGYANGGWSNAAKAYAHDAALEDGSHVLNAYRVGAITNVLELGANYALCPGLALDFNVQQFGADADGGHTYDGYTASAGLLYRF